MRRPTVGRGCQAGVTPNLLIAHLEKIAPPPVLLREPSPPLASVNNQLMLKELKCAVCSNILSQPLELQCSALVCTKCLQEWIAASGAVNCLCCSEGGPLVSSHDRPAPGVILLLQSDVLVHCTNCSGDVKAGLAIPWNKLTLLRRYVTTCSKGTNSNSLVFQVAQIARHLSGW